METDKERRKQLEEAWHSIKAIYLMGEAFGYLRIKSDHWHLIERICDDWAERQRAGQLDADQARE